MINKIEINIKNYGDVIAKFDNDKLSQELASFIYRECLTFPLKSKIEINIKSESKLSKANQNNITDMIHAYFGQEISHLLIVSKHQTYRQIVLFLLGGILIAFSALKILSYLYVLKEICLIIGWVMIWEVVYTLLFDDVKRRIKLKKYKQLCKAKINFFES